MVKILTRWILDLSSYETVTADSILDLSSYELQSANSILDLSSYELQSADSILDLSSYELLSADRSGWFDKSRTITLVTYLYSWVSWTAFVGYNGGITRGFEE